MISYSFYLGLQRQMAPDFPRSSYAAFETAPVGDHAQFRGGCGRAFRSPSPVEPSSINGACPGGLRFAVIRAERAIAQDQGRAPQLSSVCSARIRLGVCVFRSSNLGYHHDQFCWNLGRIQACTHRRFRCHDGVLHWTTRTACIFRDAAAFQYQAHVFGSGPTFDRLPSPSQF